MERKTPPRGPPPTRPVGPVTAEAEAQTSPLAETHPPPETKSSKAVQTRAQIAPPLKTRDLFDDKIYRPPQIRPRSPPQIQPTVNPMARGSPQPGSADINSGTYIARIPMVYEHYIRLSFGPVDKHVLVDTGSSMSTASTALLDAIDPGLKNNVEYEGETASLINDQKVNIKGRLVLTMLFRGKPFCYEFAIIDETGYWAVLGTDFFAQFGGVVDYNHKELCLTLPGTAPSSHDLAPVPHTVPVIGALARTRPPCTEPSLSPEICDPPDDPHDQAYFQKVSTPSFENVNNPSDPLPPVPLDLTHSDRKSVV